MRQTRQGNGRWTDEAVAEIVAYARSHTNIEAIRKYGVAPMTFYGWLRRPEYRKRRRVK